MFYTAYRVAISLDPMKLHFFGSLAVRQTFRWCIAVNSRFVSWPVSMMVIVWLIGQMDDIYVIHSSNSSISINIWARKLVQRAKLKCERCSFHCSQSLCVLTDIHDDNWPVQSIAQMDDIYVIHSVVHVLHSVQGCNFVATTMKLHFFGSPTVRQAFR